MNVRAAIVAQFRQPRGLLGALIGVILARRPSNVARNRWTVQLLDIGPDDRVLEIGCGPGVALAEILARGGACPVVGIDHSPVMIEQAARRNSAAVSAGRLKLVVGDLSCLAATQLRFTKAYMINVAQFMPDMAAAFHTVAGSLFPGGTLAVTHQPRTPNPTAADSERAAAAIVAAMTAAGFLAPRVELLPLKPAPAVCVLGRLPP